MLVAWSLNHWFSWLIACDHTPDGKCMQMPVRLGLNQAAGQITVGISRSSRVNYNVGLNLPLYTQMNYFLFAQLKIAQISSKIIE